MSESEKSLSRHAAANKTRRTQKPVFSATKNRTTLAVFARAPQLGKVKTRLARSIGKAAALNLYVAMLRDTLALSQRTAQEAHGEVILFFTPQSRSAKFASREYSRESLPSRGVKNTRRALLESAVTRETVENEYSLAALWSGAVAAQSEGDLGEKMRDCDALLRGRGAHRVVIIGCDAPDLPPQIIGAAFAALEHCDFVFGPAHDGGFYLIGASRKIPRALFSGVRWSRADVLSRVLANARREKLRVRLLPTWRDVDDISDLRALKKRLQNKRTANENRRMRMKT